MKHMLLLNCPLMINWHRTKAGLMRFTGDWKMVFGGEDPSARLVPVVSETFPGRMEVIPGEDHHLSKGVADFTAVVLPYLHGIEGK